MKKLLLTAICLSLSGLSAVHAVEDGSVFNELTTEIATPHYEWGKDLEAGGLRALFITAIRPTPSLKYGMLLASRQVVEWAQRGDLDFEAVTADLVMATRKDDPQLAIFPDESADSYRYSGTQRDDKRKDLLAKLEKPHELYVLAWISFRALPPEAAHIILRRVLDGAGLVLIGEVDTGLPKMFRKPSLDLAAEILRLDVNAPTLAVLEQAMRGKGDLWAGYKAPLRAYELGKGRVYQVSLPTEPRLVRSTHYYPPWRQYFKDFKPEEQAEWNYKNQAPVPIWWGQFETMNGTFLRLFKYAAGRRPKAAMTCPELVSAPELPFGARTVTVELDNPEGLPGTIEYRVRSDENKLAASGSARIDGSRAALDLPALKSGRYFLDLISRVGGGVDDLGVCAFSVKVDCAVTIQRGDDRIQDGVPLEFSLAFSRPVRDAAVRVTLADSPFDRVWASETFAVGNVQAASLALTNWFIPKQAATLRVTLLENGRELAGDRMTLFRPEGNRVPDWFEVPWYHTPMTPVGWHVDQTLYGWQGLTMRFDGDANRFAGVQEYMVAGLIPMPWAPLANWYVHNQRNKTSVGYGFDEKTQSSYPDFSVYGPKNYGGTDADLARINAIATGMEKRPDAVREVMKMWKAFGRPFDYGVQIFNLGDETHPGIDLFFGDFAKQELQAFLKRKYGTIDALNAKWNRSYNDFAEIPLMTTGDATAKKRYPEGRAQREFAVRNYFDIHTTIGQEIRKSRADAIYGPNSVSLIEFLEHPEFTGTWPHVRNIQELEMIRTMRPDFSIIPLYGYEQKNNGYPNRYFWSSLISGVPCGHMFFITGVGGHGSLCADYRDLHPNNTVGRLLTASGLGTLVHGMKVENGEVAVLTSSASRDANVLAADFATSYSLTTDPLFEYAQANGIVLDYFTTAALNRLPRYKTVVLAGFAAVSPAEAEALVTFVKAGGTVVADINPGVFNEDMGVPDHNPLAELFGDLKPASVMGRIDFNGMKVNGVEGLPTMQTRQVGKGRAILMNTTLAGISAAYSDPGKYAAFMKDFAADIGMRAGFAHSGLPAHGSMIRHSTGPGFDMIAFANEPMAEDGKGTGKVTVTFPNPGYIYECMQGFVREGDTLTCEFDPPFKFFTCFPEKQQPPAIRLSATATEPGRPIWLDLEGYPAGRVMNVVLRDHEGRLVRPRSEISVHERVTVGGSRKAFPIHFSFDDPKGRYTLTVTDVATGLKSDARIALK